MAQKIKINGKEYAWADIQFAFLGRLVVGVTEIKYGSKRKREFIYATGDLPVAYANGPKTSEGSITVLQSEFDAMARSAADGGYDVTSLPPFDIIVQYLDESNLMVKDIVRLALLMEWEKASKQGDLNMTVALPFVAADVELQAA